MELGVRVIEACVELLRVAARSRDTSSRLATVRLRLRTLDEEARAAREAEEAAAAARGDDKKTVTRGVARVRDQQGQESQFELVRCVFFVVVP